MRVRQLLIAVAIVATTPLLIVSACGGKAVIDPGGVGGTTGSNSSSSNSGTSNGGTLATTTISVSAGPGGGSTLDCNDLVFELEEAIRLAAMCDTCDDGPDECEYTVQGVELTDACGCPAALNATASDAVARAIQVFEAFEEQNCQLDCQTPCAVTSDPTCQSLDPSCNGTCSQNF